MHLYRETGRFPSCLCMLFFMFFDAFYFHCARWICGLTSLPGFYVFAFEPPFVPLYLYFLMEPYYSLFQKLTQFSWGPNEIYVTWFALNNRKMCTKLASSPPRWCSEKKMCRREVTHFTLQHSITLPGGAHYLPNAAQKKEKQTYHTWISNSKCFC